MVDEKPTGVPSIWSHLNLPKIFLGPAGEAISRLIGRAADIPDAKIAAHVQKIKDETEARSIVTKALAQAAANKATTDPAIVERAMDAFVVKELRKQENREAIAQRTVELLAEAPEPGPNDPQPTTPDEDWMNLFEAHAENASTERMREMWARVLAGEIRKPHGFSLKTLGFISQLDQQIATLFEKYASRVMFGDTIAKTGPLQGQELADFLFLEEFGLVSGASGMLTRKPRIAAEHGGLLVNIASGTIVLVRKQEETPREFEIPIPMVLLSSVGRQIYSVLSLPFDLEAVRGIINLIPKDHLDRISVYDRQTQVEGEVLWRAETG